MTMMKRSPPTTTCCILIIMAFCFCTVVGNRVFKVGDEFGWRVPLQNDTAFYSRWASSNRFHIGDSLSFVYEKEDSVMEVDKYGFYHCNASESTTSFDNGNSTLNLDHPGLFYFISGSNQHCISGQRLIVEVMHIHDHHYNPSSMPPSMSPLPGSPSASAAFSLMHPFVSFLSLLPSTIAISCFCFLA